MFKIKKKVTAPKPPILYNVIEDYSEFDAPGNMTACAMTHQGAQSDLQRGPWVARWTVIQVSVRW
jgi:hypothetical protein